LGLEENDLNSFLKLSCAVIFLFTLLLLSGCGFKDIDKRFFVVSIGIDLAKNSSKKYLFSLKFAIPGVKDQPAESMIVSEKADTISEAVRIIKTKVDKEIDFSHAKVIIFGQDVVKQELPTPINYWFVRRRDIQKIAWMGIGKPSAIDVLKVKPKSEHLPSNFLFLALGKEGSETPFIIPSYYFDFKKRTTEKGLDPILPILEVNKDKIEINTVGLFNKKRMVQTLTPEETMILNFFLGREEKSALKVRKGKDVMVFDTNKVKNKYKIGALKGKQPYIMVNSNITGIVEEAVGFAPYNSLLSVYEKAAEKEINKRFKNVLLKLQKAKVDPIGFGLRYRGRHFNHDDWEEWKRLYPTITFKIHSKVEIRDTGLIE
jgi:spore germination protein KC